MSGNYMAVVDDVVITTGTTVAAVWADVVESGYANDRGRIINQDGGRRSFYAMPSVQHVEHDGRAATDVDLLSCTLCSEPVGFFLSEVETSRGVRERLMWAEYLTNGRQVFCEDCADQWQLWDYAS